MWYFIFPTMKLVMTLKINNYTNMHSSDETATSLVAITFLKQAICPVRHETMNLVQIRVNMEIGCV